MVPLDAGEGFRVNDRRRRSQEEAEAPSPSPARQEPSHAAPPPRAEETPRAQETSQAAAPPPIADADRNLAGLFVMLSSSAALALGEAPDPVTGEVYRDIEQAAEMIDLLVLLREKTEGNRTPEETQILDELIYDLQLRYVAATRRAGGEPGPSRL